MAQACIDANLVLAWVLPSQASRPADLARQELEQGDFELVGPPLLYVEVPSVIRSHVHSKRLDKELAEDAFNAFCDLRIERLDHEGLHIRAWLLATELGMSKTYDAQYLATADLLGCNLWTMDQRLVRQIGGRFPRLKVIA